MIQAIYHVSTRDMIYEIYMIMIHMIHNDIIKIYDDI
jgi:hypothetical protein